MPLSDTYATGTISVTAGAVTVTGSGTLWLAHASAGDALVASGLVAIVGSVDSNTQITLEMSWPGATLAGAAYLLLKNSWLRTEAKTTARQVAEFVSLINGVGVIHPVTGAVPDPDLGEDDQYALDFGAQKFWKRSGGAWGAATQLGLSMADADDVIYVAKTGSDANTGRKINLPKLTIAAAITAAAALGAPKATIEIIDSGVYTENLTLTANMRLHAPRATLVGTLAMDAGTTAVVWRHYAAANSTSLVSVIAASGEASFYYAHLIDGRGTGGALTGTTLIENGSSGRVVFAHIDQGFVSASGFGARDNAGAGFGHTHIRAADLYLAGNSAVGLRADNANTDVIGYIDHILESGSLTGTSAIHVAASGATVRLVAAEIVVDEVYNVAAGGVLYLAAPRVVGTRTGTPTVLGAWSPSAANRYTYSTGANATAEGVITSAGRALIDDVDAAAQLATLGLANSTTAGRLARYTGTAGGQGQTASLLEDGTGKIGIGSTTPASAVDIRSTASNGGGSIGAILSLYDRNTLAAGSGAKIVFGGVYTGTTVTEGAQFGAVKDNATDGQYGFGLNFTTRPHGSSLTERMRITAGGNVGIGTSSPGCALDVAGPIRCGSYTVGTVPSASAVGAGAQIYVSNESGGAVMAFSDGTSWRRVTDRAVIS